MYQALSNSLASTNPDRCPSKNLHKLKPGAVQVAAEHCVSTLTSFAECARLMRIPPGGEGWGVVFHYLITALTEEWRRRNIKKTIGKKR
jgi:hypothetical protein